MTDTIFHTSLADWAAVRGLRASEHARLAALADLCRIDALYMIRRAGSGHIGSSFSSLDIAAWVFRDPLLRGAPAAAGTTYFSSKGHDVPGLYSLLVACGTLPRESLHRLRRLGGLPGHPDVGTPGMVANCGSLGMGISKAKGLIMAARRTRTTRPVVVMTGDGELQEGQVWESLAGAVNRCLSELRVVVDHNKIQSDTWVSAVSDLGDLEAKFAAFGWNVSRCDGHDVAAIESAFAALDERAGPGVVIADTVKGKGVSFMEGIADGDDLYRFHSGAPDVATCNRAVDEIRERVDRLLAANGSPPLELEAVPFTVPDAPVGQRLVAAYSRALVELARRDSRVIALDGDLVLDTGLIPFSKEFPERFVECGIAEQDMVGQAGGLALAGLKPVVHSFASFLTARPAEQIATNASERTKILYVGSLAGVVPGGPGHSHQSVRDVAMMASVPGMVAVEPCLEAEVAPLLDHLADDDTTGSGYLRLVSVPVDVPFTLPEAYVARRGVGWTVRDGGDLLAIGAGPVALSSLYGAAKVLSAEHHVEVHVVAMPWLNVVDDEWLAGLVAQHERIVVVENHLVVGGLGASLRAALDSFPGIRVSAIGLAGFPESGRNDEVLAHHGLDARGLADAMLALRKADG